MTPWVVRVLGDPPVHLQVNPVRAFRIGRDTEADLCLDDRLVSRRHCELRVTSEGWLELKDLGSRNGTRVNGKPVQGAIRARPGDEVRIGSATLIVDGPQSGAHPRETLAPSAADDSGGAVPLAADGAPPPRAEPPPVPPEVRTAIPGYELLSERARGRTGVIYRARPQTGDRRERYLKVLDPTLASSEQALARFQAEASALSRIDHPNIVRLVEIGCAAGRHFYVTEPVSGEVLADLLRAGPLKPRNALSIAIQVARGLSVAHGLGIVHRDVAPASVVVAPEGVAKVFDFAFAKLNDEMPSFTNLGDVVGDLRYSSPEQAGNPKAADHRSDIYGLGATLYHAIAGRPPLEGRNYLDTFSKVASEIPRPLAEAVHGVRPRLSQVVAKLLDKDPEQRFQTALEVAQALAEALLEAVIATRSTAPAQGAGIGADFHGLELLEIVQVIEARRASGILAIISSDGATMEGEIHFRGGEVIGAAGPSRDAIAAVTELLDLRDGAFAFRSDPHVSGELKRPLRATDLALEALRRRMTPVSPHAPAAHPA